MSMAYVYACLILHEAKKEITDEAICKILEAAGITPDKALAKAWADVIKTLNIEELKKRAVAVPMAAAPAVTVTPAAPEAKPEEKKEEKKEEKREEKKEEAGEALEGLSALFG